MENWLQSLRQRAVEMGIEQKKNKYQKVAFVRLNKASEQRKVNMTELDKKIQELEIDH